MSTGRLEEHTKIALNKCHNKGIGDGVGKVCLVLVKCLILIVFVATPFRSPGLGPNQALSTPFSNTPEVLVKVYFQGSPKSSCKGLFRTKA